MGEEHVESGLIPGVAPEFTDVLIIGAGISGINAAYRIHEQNPRLTYTILERRERIGGTWDLFRYPGIRSDSDIFTLSFPYEPWTREEHVADGADIRAYLTHTARKYGIDRHIRFGTRVLSADWDSATDTWSVRTESDGVPATRQARFLFFGTGYYDYDHPHTPPIAGMDDFTGTVVHPQFWPESLDYAGKNIVVIGSGATAISLVPALARTAGHVTMLQRSPTYMMAMPAVPAVMQTVRKLLPDKLAHRFIRFRNAWMHYALFLFFRKAPGLGRRLIRNRTIARLPAGYPVDVHFKPRYRPWDQRMCLVLDGDLYEDLGAGRADIVTDHIDHVDATGIVLAGGGRLDADIIVTATGLQLQALGGIELRIDGQRIEPTDRFVYKEHLLEEVPNMAWCVGYTNASWTLRADMTAKSVAKLLAYMDTHGYTHAYPHRNGVPIQEKPAWDINAGYVARAPHALPKSGTRRPWNVRHNYGLDVIDHRFDRIEESMVFGRAPARTLAEPAPVQVVGQQGHV
ncbi:NAD(P)/FAD-dependent oxidoreductase [Mycolicibacterium cosmeticum]|uniref:Monooxygenase, flavin-binding family protein n=1 Tax=Mycolicibacterium cosmeticum TaxID=258533 RepID=W9B5J6_MYCCO|nr:NAD(P)/FAD-dependent oxidoreductase [Mycolicibacterium cosmeticum]TLH81570.1 NAD(P)/FAD-dependent oxidoreductase [Mycolicibacterium cosmeticum]CDO10292.1 monooxygenase, flavin-binding family protein [Mycolicibacterium cosmeticum]